MTDPLTTRTYPAGTGATSYGTTPSPSAAGYTPAGGPGAAGGPYPDLGGGTGTPGGAGGYQPFGQSSFSAATGPGPTGPVTNVPDTGFSTPQGAAEGLNAVVPDGMNVDEIQPVLREYFNQYAAHERDAIGNSLCGKEVPQQYADDAMEAIAQFQQQNPSADAGEIRAFAQEQIEIMHTSIKLAGGCAQMASNSADQRKKEREKAESDAKSANAG